MITNGPDDGGVSGGFRGFVVKNLVVCSFFFSYFCTVVLGNFLFETQLIKDFIIESGYSEIYSFQTIYGVGYWVLLGSPYIAIPLAVYVINRTRFSLLFKALGRLGELRKRTYLISVSVLYAYVLLAFIMAEAWGLLVQGGDAVAAVEARFILRERLGFWPLMVVMSMLPFLSIYSVICGLRWGGRFWLYLNAIHFTLLSSLYVLLNMKWPIVLYYISILLAVFVYSRKSFLIRMFFGFFIIVSVFLVVSAFVFRLEVGASDQADYGSDLISKSQYMFLSALNRMAIIYPYYFEIGDVEGAVCEGVLGQLQFGAPCRPSTYVYTRMFGFDGFEGRGTAPAAAHITGFVLGGWPMAVASLFLMSIFIGILSSIPLSMGSLSGSVAIYGAVAGYHLSQVPLEGVLLYDHGFFWVILLVFFLLLLKKLRFRL